MYAGLMGLSAGRALPDNSLNLDPRTLHLQASRQVRNWPVLDFRAMVNVALRRPWQPHEAVVDGLDQPIRLEGTHQLVLAYAGLRVGAVLFGEDRAPGIAREIVEIGARITADLRHRFTVAEFRNSSTGGRPGLKDAILYGLVRRFAPAQVVETGVAQGVSSTFILSAMEKNGSGHLVSIDLPNFDASGRSMPAYGGRVDHTYVKGDDGPGWLVPDPLRSRWTLRLGAAEDCLPQITGPIDLFFHDSLHTREHMLFEYEWALDRLPNLGFLVSDDIYWNSAFSDFTSNHQDQMRVLSRYRVGVAQIRPGSGFTDAPS
jgi:predicted O-methyltransferase YrrM